MNSYIKRFLSLCLAFMIMAVLLPQMVLAAEPGSEVNVVRLTGMTGVTIKANQAAPIRVINITDEGGNVISDGGFSIDKTWWIRACDGAELAAGGFFKFESGTEYCYAIGVKITDSNLFFGSECEFFLDGEKLSPENILLCSPQYSIIRTNVYTTDGILTERLEDVELTGVRQPLSTDSAADLISTISTPVGALYSIASAEWQVYDAAKKKYVKADDFKEASLCQLVLEFDVAEGYGLSNNTNFNLNSNPKPEEIIPNTLPFTPGVEKPSVIIRYNIKGPIPNTVTLDANGGRFVGYDNALTIEMQTLTDGKIENLPNETSVIKKEGYYLEGWFTEPDGGEQVHIDKIYHSNTTIYAHWKEIIDEVRFYYIEPMNGRKPVLYKYGTENYTVSQLLQGKSSGKRFSDSEISNEFLASIYNIIEKYSNSDVYDYYATAEAVGEKKFTDETKVYINDVERSNNLTRPSSKLQASKTYYCSEEYDFKVFNRMPVEIPAGVSGSEINVDLNDYISCTGNYIVTGDEEFNDYGLLITGNRCITGVYPSVATDEKDFIMTVVSDSGKIDTLPVHIGRTETASFIESISDDVITECVDSTTLHVKVCAPAGATITYDWQYLLDSQYYSIKMLINTFGIGVDKFKNYDTPSLAITNNAPESLARYRCVVKVNGEEVKKGSNIVKHTVRHRFDSYTQNDSTYHNRICNRCSYTDSDGDTVTYKEKEKHTYKYELISEATPYDDGQYKKICVKCGYEAIHAFTESDIGSSTIIFFFDKRESGSQPYKFVKTKTYKEIYIPKDRPFKSGYSFLGWTVDKDGQTADYLPGDKVFVTEGLSLYAVFADEVVMVDGKNINADNAEVLFGDKVKFTPGTSVSAPKLTLNNAHIKTYPVYTTDKPMGIHTAASLDIELIGDNIIEADASNAIGIMGEGIISVFGDGTLTIKGADKVAYDKGIKAMKIENLAEKMYIKDCKTAFDGDTTLAYGITEIYYGNYSKTDFKAFTQEFSQSIYSPMKTIGTTLTTVMAYMMHNANAVNARYVLIAPSDRTFISYNPDRESVIAFSETSDAIICLGQYDNKRLTALEINEVNKERKVWSRFDNDNIPVKIMLWSDSLAPLCDAVTVEK